IPRPRNAFIIFRCQFVHQNCVPSSVERNNRNLSRITGFVWRGMTDFQKLPWKVLAEEEKIEHAILYPDYKFQPRKR
ncbi:high mobility group box domain-containing protein, partial [Armillaria fumosa]